VKIFDLGLAKEFDPANADKNGMYKLTGDTGSSGYMATEVALGKPYNERCDVYSLSILVWQMLSLDTPFAGYTVNMFRKRVVEGGVRPKLDPKWSTGIKSMLAQGWGDHRKRQSMDDFGGALCDELQAHSEDYEAVMGAAARNGELSLRGDKSIINRNIGKGSKKGKGGSDLGKSKKVSKKASGGSMLDDVSV